MLKCTKILLLDVCPCICINGKPNNFTSTRFFLSVNPQAKDMGSHNFLVYWFKTQ